MHYVINFNKKHSSQFHTRKYPSLYRYLCTFIYIKKTRTIKFKQFYFFSLDVLQKAKSKLQFEIYQQATINQLRKKFVINKEHFFFKGVDCLFVIQHFGVICRRPIKNRATQPLQYPL